MVTVALDTNVLAYAENTNGPVMKDAALALVDALHPESTVIPVQALAELFNVLVRKARWPAARAKQASVKWGDAFPLIETSPEVVLAAFDLAVDHRFRMWDAIILASAADARCRLLLSEDLQNGFTWRGVTVTNPFAESRHELLEALLTDRD